jgi:DMSO/TMAO reductase YedYZ molybdopterin-dependent catalytic subunit
MMTTRRRLLQRFCSLGALVLVNGWQLLGGVRAALAKAVRRIVEPGTPMSRLQHEDPAELDTSKLQTTPVSEFDVMGETEHSVDLDGWRLEIGGAVEHPAALTYEQLISRPVLERNALLICPGFFAYNGLWKGCSVADLLAEAGVDPSATRVKFSGSEGLRRKNRRYDLAEVLNDQIFIAYGVNGQALPQRHGFPVRLVAEGYKGYKWVKYVNRITVEL